MYFAALNQSLSPDPGQRSAAEKRRSSARCGPARVARRSLWPALVCCLGVLVLAGCTSAREWWSNGLKVGPNYRRPTSPVAEKWIDEEAPQLSSMSPRYASWWTIFNDPMLNALVDEAYQENLPLKVAAWRIVEARAQRGVAAGNVFAQLQEMTLGYSRSTSSGTTRFGGIPVQFPKAYFQRWSVGFDASWELDFWGRYRREIEAADANLVAQIADYDDVLVILQAEVAATYVDMRTLQERLRLARQNVRLQEQTLRITQDRFEVGTGAAVDVEQAKAQMAVTRSAIPLLEISYRQSQNRLCVLLGVPPHDLRQQLAETGPIPQAPLGTEILVGIPAELLRRRPDIRRAERQVAAESARIGVATSDLYPHFSITGNIGLESLQLRHLFMLNSTAGSIAPGVRWDILNYWRLLDNIEAQDARFQQSAYTYQDTVLKAGEEVENAMVGYLQEQQRLEPLSNARNASKNAYELSLTRYEAGTLDFQRVLDSQRSLVQEEDRLAEGQGNVALRLIALYKALGGGWRVRCGPYEYQVPEVPAPTEVPPPEAAHGGFPTYQGLPQRLPVPVEPAGLGPVAPVPPVLDPVEMRPGPQVERRPGDGR